MHDVVFSIRIDYELPTDHYWESGPIVRRMGSMEAALPFVPSVGMRFGNFEVNRVECQVKWLFAGESYRFLVSLKDFDGKHPFSNTFQDAGEIIDHIAESFPIQRIWTFEK